MNCLFVLLMLAISVTCQELDHIKADVWKNDYSSSLETKSTIQKRVPIDYGIYTVENYDRYVAANPHNQIPEYLIVFDLDGQGPSVVYNREQIFNAMTAGIRHFIAETRVNSGQFHFPHQFNARDIVLQNAPVGDGTRPYQSYVLREPNLSPPIWDGSAPPGLDRVAFDEANGRYMGVMTHRGHSSIGNVNGLHWGSPSNQRGDIYAHDHPALENIPGVPVYTNFNGRVLPRPLIASEWKDAKPPVMAWGFGPPGGSSRRGVKSSFWTRVTWF